MTEMGRCPTNKVCLLSYDSLDTNGRGFIRALKEIESLSKVYEVEAIGLKVREDLPSVEFYRGVRIRRITPSIGFDRKLQHGLRREGLLRIIGRLYTLTVRNTFACGPALFREGWKENADIYHCLGIYSLLPGLLLKIFKRRKVIYDPIEPVPYKVAAISSLGRFARLLARLVEIMENFLASRVDYVLVTPSANDEYFNRFKKHNKNVTVLMNVPTLEWAANRTPELFKDYNGYKVLIYVGALVKSKGILTMLRVFSAASKDFNKVKLVLAGSFGDSAKEIMQYIQQLSIQDNVLIIGDIPWQEIPNYLASADIALHLYQPLPGITENMGSASLFEYMSASLPVVASDFPAYQLVREYNCGILVDPTNEPEMTSVVLKLLRDPELTKQLGGNGRKAFEQEFNWGLEEKQLLQVYSELERKLKK
jgi:glycosyltransferase involved in cell wall biosynthesis